MSQYARNHPDEPINHDWFAGAAGYSSSDLDKLQKQESLDTELADNANITVNLSEIFGQEPDE